MSNTPKTPPDAAAIDASISVLGDESGEAKLADIDRGAGRARSAGVEQAGGARGAESAQETLDAPIAETPEAGRSPDRGSVERPGNDPDLV